MLSLIDMGLIRVVPGSSDRPEDMMMDTRPLQALMAEYGPRVTTASGHLGVEATKGEIVSFYSPHDHFILGWGTSQFGTVDRVYGPSAGLRKFTLPKDLNEHDRAMYDRLVEVPWNPRMICEGHTGTHFGTSLPAFLAKEVAPWLKP